MKDLGKGIGVAGIWIGVGISGFGAGQAAVGVAIFAMIATIFMSFS